VTPAEYWSRIRQLPLHPDREASDGTAKLFRKNDGTPVRIDNPDDFSPERRKEMIEFYEEQYSARDH